MQSWEPIRIFCVLQEKDTSPTNGEIYSGIIPTSDKLKVSLELANEWFTVIRVTRGSFFGIIISGYLHPNTNDNLAAFSLNEILDKYAEMNTIVSIDSNGHSPSWFSNYLDSRGAVVENIIFSKRFIILNNLDKPTWESRGQSSHIDLSLVGHKLSNMVVSWDVSNDFTFSHHNRLDLKIRICSCRVNNYEPPSHNFNKYNTKNVNWDSYSAGLLGKTQPIRVLQPSQHTQKGIDDWLQELYSIIDEVSQECLKPKKRFTGKFPNPAPWWTDEHTNSKRACNRYRNLIRTSFGPIKDEYIQAYKLAKAKFRREVGKAKEDWWNLFCESENNNQ